MVIFIVLSKFLIERQVCISTKDVVDRLACYVVTNETLRLVGNEKSYNSLFNVAFTRLP